jgi:hypothetical protein
VSQERDRPTTRDVAAAWPASPGEAWTASLDDDPVPSALRTAQRRSWDRRRAVAGLAVVAAVVAISAVLLPSSAEPSQARAPAVVGAHLAVPVTFRVPHGATATVDGSYVRLQLDHSRGAMLVTAPTQVVEPSGRRAAMPDDGAAWLRAHPGVLVIRTRHIHVGGRPATQVDYRLSQEPRAGAPRPSLPLFCGWQADPHPADGIRSPCTRIPAGARARAAFLPVGDRILMVQAVWPDDAFYGRMPLAMRNAYYGLLNGLSTTAAPA